MIFRVCVYVVEICYGEYFFNGIGCDDICIMWCWDEMNVYGIVFVVNFGRDGVRFIEFGVLVILVYWNDVEFG